MNADGWPRSEAELVAKLSRQRDRYEQLVGSMSDLLLLLDPDGRITYTNKPPDASAASAGYPPVGSLLAEAVNPEDRDILAHAMRDLLSGRTSMREITLRIQDAGGDERTLEGGLMAVRDIDRAVQVQFLGRDATDWVRSAQTIQQVNEALRRRQEQLERDLDVAATIHRSLLPPPMETERILIDLKHVPLIGVGGDYVHIQPDPLRPSVTIFDVSGHGIASSLVASRVHSAVLSIMTQGAPPSEMVRQLNRFVFSSFADLGIFVTLFGMQLDLEAGTAACCGAGHPPALRRRGRDILQLTSTHLPIGVAEDIFMGEPTRTVSVEPGDTVWLYTDGLVELSHPDGRMMGIEELVRLVAQWTPDSLAPGLADRFLQHATAGYDAPDDDLTVVAVAVK